MTRPSNIDTPDIGDRMRQIADERMAVIAGCTCAADGNGNVNHRDGCPLYPGAPPVPPKPLGWADMGMFAILADHRRAVADHIDDAMPRRQGR